MPARKIVNWEGGSDARYDTSEMSPVGDGRYYDGTYYYDSDGRPLDAIPGGNEWTPGLPGARGGTGPGDLGSGGGGGSYGGVDFQQIRAMIEAQRAAAAASRKESIRDALIAFGLVPEGFQDPYGDIDQTTRDLASANTTSGISAYARMREALSMAQRDSSRNLTARGLRRSGDRGYQINKNQLGFDRNYSDALNSLLGGAKNIYSNFAQGEYGRQMSLADSLRQSMQNWSPPPRINPPAAPTTTTPETGPAYYSNTWGQPGYKKPLLGLEDY